MWGCAISPQSLAEDTISRYPLGSLDPVNCIRWFKPNNLSLFDAVLLAQVVNKHAPIYGLFDNMCYMFANIIFDAVVQVYTISPESSSTPSSSSEGPPAPTIEVSSPANANILVFSHGFVNFSLRVSIMTMIKMAFYWARKQRMGSL